MGAGNINIAGLVTITGALDDNTNTNLNIVAGGNLGGPGSLDDWANVNWTGGIISLSGGVTVYTTFTENSGSNALTLDTTLTNEETTSLSGATSLTLGAGGAIDNFAGTMALSQSVYGMLGAASGGVTNSALGILNIAGTSVTVAVPFTNEGNLDVGTGSALDLTSPPSSPGGTPTIDLDGTLGLDGNLYLYSTATSSSGFTLLGASGFFEVGGGLDGLPGTLIVPSGVSDIINGNLEITSGSLLTGGGTVYNSGLLQLDVGSSTMGLSDYVQGASGTLAVVVLPFGTSFMYSPLMVTGTAELSGTLTLPGYDDPEVGDSFTVVDAGDVEAHFIAIPSGMEQTETDYTASVTQVE